MTEAQIVNKYIMKDSQDGVDKRQNSTQLHIGRQCALKAAVELFKNAVDIKRSDILETADEFVEWINGN